MVGTTGFEPATSCSQSKRSSQTELRPESKKLLAARLGFEPRQTDPESAVLPLHHQAKIDNDPLLIDKFITVKPFSKNSSAKISTPYS